MRQPGQPPAARVAPPAPLDGLDRCNRSIAHRLKHGKDRQTRPKYREMPRKD